jgi:hypothetical protein
MVRLRSKALDESKNSQTDGYKYKKVRIFKHTTMKSNINNTVDKITASQLVNYIGYLTWPYYPIPQLFHGAVSAFF